jgi:aspartate aminotransferase-like enzyme
MARPIIDHRGPEFHAIYERIAENLRYAFQTKGDVFTLSASGTGGVEAVIANAVRRGDKVIIPVNGDFSQRIKENVEYFGGVPVEVPVEWGKAPTASRLEEAMDNSTDAKLIFVIYNETSTGATTRELAEICKAARRRGLLTAVDAISNFAGDRLPVDEWGVDFCVAGSQKCLACPPGLVMVSVSPAAWDAIKASRPQSNYWDLAKYKNFDARKETPFTPAVSLYYALDEALQMLKEEGLENRIARHSKMAQAFYVAVEALGLTIFPDKSCRSNTVIAIRNPPGVDVHKVRRIMREQYSVVIAGGMGALRETTFRIGSMGTVSPREVRATVRALEMGLNAVGYSLRPGSGLEAAEKALR